MKNIFKKLSLLTIVAIITFAIFSNAPIVKAVVANKIPTPIALYEDSLASAINSTATSFSLVRGTDIVGTSLAASTYGFIIDEGSATQEFVIADCTGTACTNAIRGVSPITGLTTVVSLEKSHRRGATVKMTDAPILLILKRLLNGDETLPNILSYVSHPTFSSNTQIVDKQYVDESASAGCGNADPSSKGCVEVATQAEVDAGTQLGGSGAYLATNPATTRAKAYHDYAVDSVGTDSYAITVSPAITAYATGQVFTFKAGTANTGAATLNVSGLGAKTIKKDVSIDLATGDILANQIVTVVYDGTNMQFISKTPQIFGDFGDGSDGDVTISTPTTLTRDMYYNNLVVTDTLNTANWRIFVKGTLSGAGTIQNNGSAGGAGATPTAGTAGAKITDGYFSTLPGYAGGAGSSGASTSGAGGTNGGASTTSIGVVGIAGGSGEDVSAYSGGAGGSAGSLTAQLQKFGILKHQTLSAIDYALNGTVTKYNGDSGSGGGGAGAVRNNGNTHTSGGGGGSGSPGGIMAIFVNNWTGTATLKSTGGAGGNGGGGTSTGSDAAGGGGGGSGGSGGVIYVIYKTKTWTGSYVLTGGAAGTKGTGTNSSGGSNGSAGTTGTSTEINIASLL